MQAQVAEPRSDIKPQQPMARSLRRRLAPEVREAIVSRYKEGESALALSEDYGISRDGVRRLLKHAGVPIRTQTVVTPKVTQQILGLYESGLTIRQIAKQVGRPYESIRRALHEKGVAMRAGAIGKPDNPG